MLRASPGRDTTEGAGPRPDGPGPTDTRVSSGLPISCAYALPELWEPGQPPRRFARGRGRALDPAAARVRPLRGPAHHLRRQRIGPDPGPATVCDAPAVRASEARAPERT